MKKYKVSYYCQNIYSIEKEFFKKANIKFLVVDLDNTLDSAYTNTPRDEAFKLKEMLNSLDITMLVISNNREKRVAPYCLKLGVKYLSSAKKFSKRKIKRWLDENEVDIDKTLFVGDQLFTDRIYVNKLKGRLILTYPLVKKDQFFTRFIRWFDNYLRQRWKRKNILGQQIGGSNNVLQKD